MSAILIAWLFLNPGPRLELAEVPELDRPCLSDHLPFEQTPLQVVVDDDMDDDDDADQLDKNRVARKKTTTVANTHHGEAEVLPVPPSLSSVEPPACSVRPRLIYTLQNLRI